jgi:small subunit ribosomal protein S3
LGIVTGWSSRWYAERDYSKYLHEDLKIQNFLKDKLMRAGVSSVEVERLADKSSVDIYTARPGIVIGRRGGEVDRLKEELENYIGHEIRINIKEITRPELDAQLVAESIAVQLEKRIHFRKAMKKAVSSAMRSGAEGIKIQCSGRIGGVEIARTEKEKEGRIPLHTLRADIDYGFAEANTVSGKIGVKAWIFKGERLAPIEEIRATRTDSRDSGQARTDRRAPRGSDRRSSERRSSNRRDSDRRGPDRGGSGGRKPSRRGPERDRNE